MIITRLTAEQSTFFLISKKRLQALPHLDVHSFGFGPCASSGQDFTILKGIRSRLSKWLWQLLPHPVVYFRLRQYLKKLQPDVIHLHNVRLYTASVLHAIKPYPVVQTIHDYGILCPSAQNLHRDLTPCKTGFRLSCFWEHRIHATLPVYFALLFSYAVRRARLKKIVRLFLAPSPLLADTLRQQGFKHARFLAPFKNPPQSPCLHAIKPLHFLFAGNLGTHKGIHVLLEEFALAHQKNNKITLTLAGKGPEEARLRKRIAALSLEHSVKLVGWKADLESEYQACAAVIFPSLGLETFGLVMTEAMNHSRAVIGANRGAIPWIIDDGKTGLVFDPLKPGDLAEKLLMLAGNTEKIHALGKQGKEKLETFIDNEAVLASLVEAYQNAMIMP